MKQLLNAARQPHLASPQHRRIQLPHFGTITYQLKISHKRQSLALSVKAKNIIVNAPHYIQLSEIERFILSRAQWLIAVLNKQDALPQCKMTYQNGAQMLFLGQWYTLNLTSPMATSGRSTRVIRDDERQEIQLIGPSRFLINKDYVKRKLADWLKLEAQQLIAKRLDLWAKTTGLQPSKLSFKFYKNRWGCCYQSGEVKFNPLIMAAPLKVIDCVVIHELCHLTHMDHSSKFWALNHRYCGHCNESKAWLTHHHSAIQLPPPQST